MNKDTLEGSWSMLKGKIKEKWGKLTDSDLTEINGKREQFLGALQQKYGYAKDKAEQELSDWEKTHCSSNKSCCSHENHSNNKNKH